MGDLVEVNFGRTDAVVTKAQFARHPQVRRSTRWVEQRVGDGMEPFTYMDGNRRMFRLEECLRWLERWRAERQAA